MEEKRYPIIEIERIPLGMFGFYTDAPDVFEQRVAEIEADMDEVDAGIEDPEKWIQVDDFWAAMNILNRTHQKASCLTKNTNIVVVI